MPAVALLAIGLLLYGCLCGCTPKPSLAVSLTGTDYSDASNWAYLETDDPATADNVDVFLLCPTVYQTSEDSPTMPLDDENARDEFVNALNMEKGIYDQDKADDNNRVFAPYYQQIALDAYQLDEEERETHLQTAYADIKAAFEYYLWRYNNGRPIVLAGFSQGADMCLRLMKDLFDDEGLRDQLVACYAIGWRVTQEEVDEFPQVKMAQGEKDTGVVISFNSEAPDTTSSLPVPEGTKTLSINPLNWKTDGTPADRSLNKGACFPNQDGTIAKELDQFTGAYIDEARGTLKITDVSLANNAADLPLSGSGVYHVYDYQFFYRNLQENVADRIDAYLSAHARPEPPSAGWTKYLVVSAQPRVSRQRPNG